MAEPLLSLMTPGTMKYVVPWKTRSDFLAVYQDLYSSDISSQESAIGKVNSWKSRAGNKLSVAIESSAALMQVRIDHSQAERDGKLQHLEHQLRSNYSLALIRFVNHITEKAQTKAVAQPVHLVAREFGIPEWIVRLRHEATHGALPCLDALATGASWALDYLRHNFWEQQRTGNSQADGEGDREGGGDDDETTTGSNFPPSRSPKTAEIRSAFAEFQRVRNQKNKSDVGDKTKADHTAVLARLQKYLSLNRMKFIKCLLEDGNLIATDEQFQDIGLNPYDIVNKLPPTIPQSMALVWRPLLKRINNAGALAFLLHTALFSVTSEHGLRNYQLVAWIAFILANTSTSASSRGRRKRQRKQDCFMSTTHPIPTRVLLSACIQNLNKLTVHLLRYLVDTESVGEVSHGKLSQLLGMEQTLKEGSPLSTTELTSGTADDSSSASSDSDSDTVYTLCHEKNLKTESGGESLTHNIEEIKKTICQDQVTWNLCKNPVDWSTIPLGVLPSQVGNKFGDVSSDEDANRKAGSDDSKSRRRGRRGKEDEYDEDDDESDHETNPKRSKLIITDELLI